VTVIEKPMKRAARRLTSRRAKTEPRRPTHSEIAERAYYLSLEQGGADELGNWLRAERELAAA